MASEYGGFEIANRIIAIRRVDRWPFSLVAYVSVAFRFVGFWGGGFWAIPYLNAGYV
mgnify:CR=1 FL=1